MKKIHTFLYVLRNSLTNFAYYSHIKKTSFFFSLQYLAGVLLLVSTITVAAGTVGFVKEFYPRIQNVETIYAQVLETFPNDFVITVKNGVLSTNKKEPVILGRAFTMQDGATSRRYKGLFAVAPQADKNDYEELNAFMIFSKTGIIVENNTADYPSTANITINKNYLISQKETILNTAQTIISSIPFVMALLVPVGIILITLVDLLLYMLLLVVLTFFTWISTRLTGLSITYNQLYRYGMHAITPVILFTLVVIFFPVISPQWSILLYAAWMIGALKTNSQ